MSTKTSITEAYAFKLNALTRRMRRFSLEQMKNCGVDITVDQWGILSLLYENKTPMSQAEIAALLIKDPPTVSRILDILCKEKLTEREVDPNDRRRFNLKITKLGRSTIRRAIPIVDQIRSDLFQGFSKREFETLGQLIDKIESNISQ